MVKPIRVPFLGDATQLAREARKAEAALAGVDRRAHLTSTALGTAFGTVAGRGIGVLASAARNAVGSIGTLASTSIQAASDTAESWSKTKQVFGQNADAVKAWADDSTKNILLTRQAALEGASTFGNLFVALGLGQEPAARLSTSLVGLAADLSSFNNVGTDEALLALRSGLLGEAEPLRKFGVSLSAARIEAEAFSLGLVKPVRNAAAITAAHNAVAAAAEKVAQVEKDHGKGTLAAAQARDGLARANASLTKALGGQKVELTAAQKAQAAYSIITKDTKTALGDAAKTQDGYANKTRILHKNLGDLSAQIGAKLLPHALRLTDAVSDLVKEFENGTGTGGELRRDLGNMAETAKGLGEDLKPALGVVRWFASHPDALKGVVEGMVAYRLATKSAALWSERLAAANTATALTGVAAAAPGAAAGVGGVAGALAGLTGIQILTWGAAAIGVLERLSDLAKGIGGDIGPLLNRDPYGLGTKPQQKDFDPRQYANSLSPEKREQFYQWYPQYRPGAPRTQSGLLSGSSSVAGASRSQAGLLSGRDGTATAAAKHAAAVKSNADRVAAAQKYAADQAEAAAKRKREAADALQKANDAMQQALEDRRSMSKGIRDSLVGSATVLREGVSWTGRDLLSRFQLQMRKVRQFSTAIGSLAAKGYDKTIIQQAAEGGVGNLGAVLGLARATPGQVRQFNATQAAINKYAGMTGDTATRAVLGPPIVNVYLDSQQIAARVNYKNVRAGRNGSRAA